MRATADLNGKVLKTLPRATVVHVLGKSNNKIVVDGTEDVWLQVKTEGGETGWVFGGFISLDFQFVNGDKKKIAWTTGGMAAGTQFIVVLYDVDSQKLKKVPIDSETSEFTFSKDLKYLAVNSGTYVFGTIDIHNVEDGKVIHNSGLYPRSIPWKGNTLEFNTILCQGEEPGGGSYVATEEVVFAGGKISRTGKYHREGVAPANNKACYPEQKGPKKSR